MPSGATNFNGTQTTLDVRSTFARQLKLARVREGYRTARSLAEVLGIDENRYTRYERAEVEPGLTMLSKICRTLAVTLDSLLSFDQHHPNLTDPDDQTAPKLGGRRTDATMWELASKVACSHQEGGGNAVSELEKTSRIFLELRSDPFGQISTFLTEDRSGQLDQETRAEFKELVEELVKDLRDPVAEGTVKKSVE